MDHAGHGENFLPAKYRIVKTREYFLLLAAAIFFHNPFSAAAGNCWTNYLPLERLSGRRWIQDLVFLSASKDSNTRGSSFWRGIKSLSLSIQYQSLSSLSCVSLLECRLLEGNSCKHLEEPNIGLLLECRTFSLISNFSEEPQIILRLISSFWI